MNFWEVEEIGHNIPHRTEPTDDEAVMIFF